MATEFGVIGSNETRVSPFSAPSLMGLIFTPRYPHPPSCRLQRLVRACTVTESVGITRVTELIQGWFLPNSFNYAIAHPN